MTTRSTLPALALLATLALASPAAAHGGMFPLPDNDFAVGPSVSYVNDGRSGWSANVDFSWSYFLFTASLNAKIMGIDDELVGGGQFELTFWMFANMGGGVGYLGGTRSGAIVHFFLGVPLPVEEDMGLFDFFDTLYVEPFYRPSYFDGRWLHEVGLMVKVTSMNL